MFACLFAVVVFSCFVNCIFFFFVTICCCCCRFCFVFAFLFCFVLLFCLVLLCQGWPRLLACIASWPNPYTIVVLKVYRKKKKKKKKKGYGTVKPVLMATCIQRPPVLRGHSMMSQRNLCNIF